MRTSKTMQRVRAGEPVRICCLGHFIPSYVRHAAHFGFDCIWLDLEHRCLQDREVQSLLGLFHLYDIDCMLRPPTREKTRLGRYLEDGATGLMVPHVSTPEEAADLVRSTKFPPIGERGLDGAGLDSDFLLAGGPEYVEAARRETFLVVQIETPLAIDNVQEIAAVPGLDGLFVGPGDLSLRQRLAPDGPQLEEAMACTAAAAARHGIAWGCPTFDPEDIRRRREQGAQLIAYGGDFMALMQALEQRQQELDDALGPAS